MRQKFVPFTSSYIIHHYINEWNGLIIKQTLPKNLSAIFIVSYACCIANIVHENCHTIDGWTIYEWIKHPCNWLRHVQTLTDDGSLRVRSSRIQSEYASFRWQALLTPNQDSLGRPTLPWRTGSVLCQDAILRFYNDHHHHHGHRLRHLASCIWSTLSPPLKRT